MTALLCGLVVLSFVGYHMVFFSYCAYIFNVNKIPLIAGIICGVLNLGFWLIYILFLPINHEPLAIFLCIVTLFFETKIVFKTGLIQVLFIAVTFTINLFAKRLVLLSVMALFNHGTIVDVMSDVHLSALVSIAGFALSISTISFSKRMIPRISLDTILADNKNLAFLTAAFSILFLTLFSFQLTISTDGGKDLLYHYAVLGTIVIGAFAVFIMFAFHLAELRVSTETYKRLSKKNTEDLENLKGLEQEATKDTLTGLYTREYADNTIQKLINEQNKMFVAFIDLDGLKIVNDDYGHAHGDFYIRTVAEILGDYFSEHTVCRYGGDEMVVVGRYHAEDEVTKKLIQCYKAVLNIPKLYEKKYATSISYGVAFKHPNEAISASALVAIADTRMYELKKSNKKHRKVVAVKP